MLIYARNTLISVWLVTDLNEEMPSDQRHSRLHSNPLRVEQEDETTNKYIALFDIFGQVFSV